MLLGLLKYIKGYVRIRVYGYSPERFLNLCSNHDILVWDLRNCGDAYEMYMSIKGFRQLRPIVRKTRTKVRIMKRCGLPFLLHRYRKRKMFFTGVVLCSAMIYLFSLFIWDIQFQGNSARTNQVLLECLEREKIRHGTLKKTIDCEKTEAMLRKEFDDIIWTSVEIKGTRLIVHVQESLKIQADGNQESDVPTDLCASRSGTVEKMITRSGTPLVNIGDEVSQGAVLVSGRLDIIGDNGEVVNYQYCNSDADIYIRTTYPYEDAISRTYSYRAYTGEKKKSYYVKFFSGKCSLNLAKKEKQSYEEVSQETQLHLWNHFYLPFYWGTVTRSYYEEVTKTYTKEEADKVARQRLEQFCEDLQKKGVQLIQNNVTIRVDDKNCIASGCVVAIEKTGESRPTEILAIQPQEETE